MDTNDNDDEEEIDLFGDISMIAHRSSFLIDHNLNFDASDDDQNSIANVDPTFKTRGKADVDQNTMNAGDDQPLIHDSDRSDDFDRSEDIDSEMEIVANNLEDQEESIEKNGQVTNDVDNRKVFVDRLPRLVKPSDLKSHFSAFGRIEDIQLNLRMGSFSAFVVYKSVEAAKKAVDAKHKINGVKVR